jgi:hypothetical protein
MRAAAASLSKIDRNHCLTKVLIPSELVPAKSVEFICTWKTVMLVFIPFRQTATFVNY